MERNKGSKSPCALGFPPGHVTSVTNNVNMDGLVQRFPHFVVTHLLDGFIDLLEKCFISDFLCSATMKLLQYLEQPKSVFPSHAHSHWAAK